MKSQKSILDKLRGGVQCYREHGFAHTLRHTLYHMGLWKDEDAPKGPENRPRLLLYGERIIRTAQDGQKDKIHTWRKKE